MQGFMEVPTTSAELFRPKTFVLKKLPMWGEQVAADAINFEWPTQEIFDEWPLDVSLKSITFSDSSKQTSFISSVQCTISTGEVSPRFY